MSYCISTISSYEKIKNVSTYFLLIKIFFYSSLLGLGNKLKSCPDIDSL